MAKKHKTAVEETQELAQKMQDDLVKDIILPEEDPEEVVPESPEPEKTEIEKKVEEVKEEKPQATPEELTASISKEVTDKVVSELDKRLPQQTTEEKEEKKDALKDYLEKSKAEGRNPTWEEALSFLSEVSSEKAYERIKSEQEAERAAQEKHEQEIRTQEEQQKAIQEEQSKVFNQVIDDELDELYTHNKLPRIKNKEDDNDPGVVARKALFQTMLDVNEKRKVEGKPAILSISRIFHTYYKPPTQQPPGAEAPVSMGQGAAEATDPDDYSYTDLKKEQKKWGFFRR